MKPIYTAIFVLGFLFFFAAKDTIGQQKAGGINNAQVEAEINKVVRDFYDAFSRLDEAAATAPIADDGFYYSIRSGYESSANVKKQYISYFKSTNPDKPKFTYQIDDMKVTVLTPDAAIANYKMATKYNVDGKPQVIDEQYTNIFAKRGGRWLLVAEHSSDIPKAVPDIVAGMPVGWIRTPRGNAERYSMTVDNSVKHSGNASALVKFACGAADGFGSLAQSIAADNFHGKRIRLSAWIKTENVEEAGLWMRLDGDGRLLGFDNMMPRAVKGTTDWKQYEVVLDVPRETVNILFGTLVSGTGQAWVDDIKLEVVGKDVPSTNQLSAEAMQNQTDGTVVKRSKSKQPSNLGFEDGIMP